MCSVKNYQEHEQGGEQATNADLPSKKGLAYAGSCYVLWGFIPVLWKLLAEASHLEIITHRMIWSFVLLFPIVALLRKSSLKALLKSRRALLILGAAAFVVACNWFVFTYAVNANMVVATSLGYFINPILSICFGMLFFKERLTLTQKFATGLTFLGVLFFALNSGEVQIILIALALSTLFALYGALKKKGGYPAAEALTVESLLLMPVALVMLAVLWFTPERVFLANPSSIENLLLSGGLVFGGGITAITFFLFALGANTVPLSWMGFMQYITPSISLLVGVFVYGELFTFAHAVCFAFIWGGLLLISAEVLLRLRKTPRTKNCKGSAGNAS